MDRQEAEARSGRQLTEHGPPDHGVPICRLDLARRADARHERAHGRPEVDPAPRELEQWCGQLVPQVGGHAHPEPEAGPHGGQPPGDDGAARHPAHLVELAEQPQLVEPDDGTEVEEHRPKAATRERQPHGVRPVVRVCRRVIRRHTPTLHRGS